MKYLNFLFFFLLLFITTLVATADAQHRDFLSDEEAEIIREYQEIDRRVKALTLLIDRRLAAAGIPGHKWELPKRDSELWGAEPKGTRTQLLTDVRNLLQKSIDDIDDIASRDSAAIEGNEKSGKLFPKAVRDLAAAATRYRQVFRDELNRPGGEANIGLLEQSIEFCDQIIEASATLPAETTKSKKKN